jgi:hypothetical protein
MIGLFPLFDPIASEQHSSLALSPKLALLQRRVKINVAQKQQKMSGIPAGPSGSSILRGQKYPQTRED